MSLEALVRAEPDVQRLLDNWSRAAHRPISLGMLIGQWTRLVDRIERGYQLSLDDYLNDVDSRAMLEQALQVSHAELSAELRNALGPFDERFVAATELSDIVEPANPWSSRVPTKMGHEMRAQLQDLERARRRQPE